VIAYREGLICLSGANSGWIAKCLRAGDLDGAQRHAGMLAEAFDSCAYLALASRPDDAAIAAEMQGIARRLGMGLAAVHPIYCLTPAEETRLRFWPAIRLNCALKAVPAGRTPEWRQSTHPDLLAGADGVAARYTLSPSARRER